MLRRIVVPPTWVLDLTLWRSWFGLDDAARRRLTGSGSNVSCKRFMRCPWLTLFCNLAYSLYFGSARSICFRRVFHSYLTPGNTLDRSSPNLNNTFIHPGWLSRSVSPIVLILSRTSKKLQPGTLFWSERYFIHSHLSSSANVIFASKSLDQMDNHQYSLDLCCDT